VYAARLFIEPGGDLVLCMTISIGKPRVPLDASCSTGPVVSEAMAAKAESQALASSAGKGSGCRYLAYQ
jgi:hypothetical protein